ncbi:MAG: metallophosphatase family protein [Oscillospiraceae bacterium]|jgi:putative phosphoesterase|nr:metallophosphatase family protein [Oscillospiraceae bacterium]
MTVAILSDIHGNLPALEAVLADAAREPVDHMMILGDILTDFPQFTAETLRLVRSLPAYVVRGNREDYIADHTAGRDGDDWERYASFAGNLETFRRLSAADLAWIDALPVQLALTFRDFSCRMVHDAPVSGSEPLKAQNKRALRRAARAVREPLLFCGHTHRPMVERAAGKWLVNPGSVGVNFDGTRGARYALLRWEDGEPRVETRSVPYDLAVLRASCAPDDSWARVCLRSIETGKNCNLELIREAQKRAGCWPVPNDIWNALLREWRTEGKI